MGREHNDGPQAPAGSPNILALGYTMPPARLSHRGLGELDVALTHGPGVVLLGHVAQGGDPLAPLAWLIGVVIGLAVIPAILLAGVPDRTADASAGKLTLVVRLGTEGTTRLVLALVPLSALGAVMLALVAPQVGVTLVLAVVLHAAVLAWLLVRYLRAGAPERRIDALLATALLYIGWFVIAPLVELA